MSDGIDEAKEAALAYLRYYNPDDSEAEIEERLRVMVNPTEGCDRGPASPGEKWDADALVYRMRNWHERCDQLDAAVAEVKRNQETLRELVDAVHAEFPAFETQRTVEAYAAALDTLGIEHNMLGGGDDERE